MARSVNDRHRCVGDAELFPIFEALVGDSGMGLLPQHLVTGMDEDPRVQFFCQLWRDRDVIVVRVGAHNTLHSATSDGIDDRIGRVGSVDNDAFRIVADNPNVVIDFPLATVECEHTVRDDPANF